MNKPLNVLSKQEPRVTLRAAAPDDLEDLRVWKNANKAGFFFQKEITPDMQKTWYKEYLNRPNDYMFIVEYKNQKVGCLAMRILDSGEADTYNIIAGPAGAGKGYMKMAMAVLCSYFASLGFKDIGCLVLKNNPAINYYQHCGFKIVGDGGDHHIFKLDWTRFKPVSFDVIES